MRYQILKDNKLVEITEEEYRDCLETDKMLYGGEVIHLSEDYNTLTIIPFTQVRYPLQNAIKPTTSEIIDSVNSYIASRSNF